MKCHLEWGSLYYSDKGVQTRCTCTSHRSRRCPRQCPCQDGNDAHKPANGSGSGNTYFRECNSCSSRSERQIWERIPLRELYSAIFLPAIVFDFCWAGLRIVIVNCENTVSFGVCKKKRKMFICFNLWLGFTLRCIHCFNRILFLILLSYQKIKILY